MKLFEAYSEKGFHSTIATTFAIDFDAFESIALPRLREAGSTNNILLADARMVASAMADGPRRPRFAGLRYSVEAVSSCDRRACTPGTPANSCAARYWRGFSAYGPRRGLRGRVDS
jgi:hypothetical protein